MVFDHHGVHRAKKKREAPATNSSHHDYDFIVLLVNIHVLVFVVPRSRRKNASAAKDILHSFESHHVVLNILFASIIDLTAVRAHVDY